jgi:hypothetical protein
MAEEDGLVRVLPPMDSLLLMDCASRIHKLSPNTCTKEDLEYNEKFKDACRRKYRTLILAWRWLLDYEGVGRVAFHHFSRQAKSIGFKEPKRLWLVLNTRRTSFFTLDEWDPVSFRNLYEFRDICLRQFGGFETAFNFGMDKNGSRTVDRSELERFCVDHDFSGDPKVLFDALDMHRHGFIVLPELDFLAIWEGEKYGELEKHFDFQQSRLDKHRNAIKIQRVKVAALPRRASSLSWHCGTWSDMGDPRDIIPGIQRRNSSKLTAMLMETPVDEEDTPCSNDSPMHAAEAASTEEY